MTRAERSQLLELIQTRDRKDINAVETLVINEFILKSHRIKREDLCVYHDDAIGCYDRTIHNYVILNSSAFRIEDNVYKYHCNVHNRMQWKTQMKYFISNDAYQSLQELSLYGVEQGTGNGGKH